MLELLQDSAALAAGVALLFGLLVGSFLNVVILRLPPRLEWQWRRDAREILEVPEHYEPAPPGIVVQRSACPKCGHRLAPWENLPLLSFVLLRGKCRGCGTPISWQYPIVELATGLMFAACVLRFGLGPEALAAMAFSGFLVALTGIDLRTTLLPDQLTYPLLWLGLGLATMTLFVSPVQAIFGALAGYLSLWSVYWGFKLLTGKEGMGHGDFKLLAGLGAWCGVAGILPIVLMSSFIGAIVGTAWLALRGQDRATPIPFGPYLAAAGWVQLMWGPQILQAYRDWSGLN
ncbi:MAG: methyltransferase [Arenimonas sp. SCN 70-307]|uniref:prepilin peptidase n=1 Tax=Arenimonas sp. SCN 70-307 TaxID=1660089 RepID=UPI000868B232|nr:A24 family peptidase [Arenimonas sp. SCN 70-307]ODS63097.1 MAG: methyltransferase [Arenimonas sp. SCN 70-307]